MNPDPSMAGAAGSVRWTTCKWFAGAWLLTLAGVFCAFASRGFEYTDESFYLLSLVWWREITSSFTLFGVVLGGLFDAVGQDITTFRILGMLALLGSSAYMAVMAFRLVSQAHAGLSALRGLVTIVVMGAALQYYDVFSVLRVPSYNLLALCALMVATGVMLDMLTRHRAGRSPVGQAVVYGVMLGLCAAGKVSTALLGALLHLVFFVASLRAPRSLAAVKAVLGALFGLALVAAVVAALQPDAIAVMRLGLTISATTDERYGLANLVNLIRWDVQRQAVDHGYVLVGLLVLGVALRRLPPTDARHLHRAILWVGLIVCVVTQVLPSLSHLWLLAALLCVLWICLPVGRSVAVAPGQSGLPPQDLRLLMLLLGLPLAFSFGTNGRVLEHSEAAAAPAMPRPVESAAST